MTFLLMGFHFRIASIVTFTVAMIVTDIMGLMYVWNISLNAVSLVNLVMVSTKEHCLDLLHNSQLYDIWREGL